MAAVASDETWGSESGPAPLLVLFCGSHVADASRLRMLAHMLASWRSQSLSVELWLSVSVATDELKADVEALLKDMKVTCCFTRERHYAQFEHLQSLAMLYAQAHASALDATWVCFTDDDDTFAPGRIACFRDIILQCPRDDTTPFVAIDAPNAGQELPMTEAQKKLAREEGVVKQACGAEYMQYCVRLPALIYFFQHASEELLRFRCADLFFQRFLHRGDRGAIRPPPRWIPISKPEDASSEYAYWQRPGDAQARFVQQGEEVCYVTDFLRLAVVAPDYAFNREDYWRWLQSVWPHAPRDEAALERRLQEPVIQAMLRAPSFVQWRIGRLEKAGRSEEAADLLREFVDYKQRASVKLTIAAPGTDLESLVSVLQAGAGECKMQ